MEALGSAAREWSRWAIDTWAFEILFSLVIIANAVVLMLYDPLKRDQAFITQSEPVFLAIFSLELAIKLFALGGPRTYIHRSLWNVLDFAILTIGWVQFGLHNFGQQTPVTSIFRLLRLIRPLQRVNPSLMWVTQSLVRATPMICSAAVVFCMLQVVFAICGLVYFSGSLRRRCSGDLDQICGSSTGSTQCGLSDECVLTAYNPDSNLTSFDDVFHVVPILFQHMTMEGWSSIMYYVADANGPATQLYSIVLVIFGGYFMLQVLVALLAVNISLERHEAERPKPVEHPEKQAYLRYCEEAGIPLIAQMQMRLVLSYELSGDMAVSEQEYNVYLEKNKSTYAAWKLAMMPVVNATTAHRAQSDDATSTATRPAPQQQQKPPPPSSSSLSCLSQCCARVQHLCLAGERPGAWFVTRVCCKVAKSRWFNFYLMNSIILLNLLTLALVHYDQPEWMFTLQDTCDWVFFGLFLGEMAVKITGFGLLQYWTNPACAFEGCITLLGFIQFASVVEFAQALRILRLLRIFPLLFKLQGMRRMVLAFALAMKIALPFVVLMILFILIFATLGLHVFGGKLFASGVALHDCSPSYPSYPNCPPRLNFDTMQSSVLTTFVLLLGENWNLVMMDVLIAMDSLWPFLYFACIIVVGSWVVLNVFLGVLIDSFLQVREGERGGGAATTTTANTAAVSDSPASDSPAGSFSGGSSWSFRLGASSSVGAGVAAGATTPPTLLKRIMSKRQESIARRRKIDLEAEESRATLALREHVLKQQVRRSRWEKRWEFEHHASYAHPSYWLHCGGQRDLWWRLAVGRVVVSRLFRAITVCTIIASSVSLAIEGEPVAVNYVFFGLFATEFVLKVAAFGFAGQPGSYLTSPWNVLDFVLLMVNLVTVVLFATYDDDVEGSGGQVGKILEATRAFSVLRIVRYVRGIQITLNSLANSCCPLVELCLVVLCFFLSWGVLGTFVFQGQFYACVDQSTGQRIPQDDLCMANPRYPATVNACPADLSLTCPAGSLWENPRYGMPGTFYSFDNLGQSLLVLFEMSTDEDWFQPMFAAMDSPMQLGRNAVREVSYPASLFFCAVVIFFNLFLMQVFVAVLVDEFRESGRVADSRAFLTPRQAEWVKVKRVALQLEFKRTPPPRQPKRPAVLHLVATSRAFTMAHLLVVGFNSCVLLSLHYDASAEYWRFFHGVDWACGAAYWSMLLIQVGAFGWRDCFARQWWWLPRLSLLVCVTTAIGWGVPGFFPTAQVIDSMQVAHLVLAVPQTRRLLTTLGLSAPQVVNVAMLLLLVMYIYSIVGVAVFSSIDVKNGDQLEHLHKYANFGSFENAIVTLFRMSSGEGWNSVMREMAVAGDNAFAFPFCLSFVMLVQFLLMNLIVAVVMFDLEDEVEIGADELSGVKKSHLVDFCASWAALRLRVEQDRLGALMHELDHPQADELGDALAGAAASAATEQEEEDQELLLPCELVFDLLDSLPEPLRVGKTHEYRSQVLRRLKIPVNRQGEVHFHCTLNALVDEIMLGDAVNFRDANNSIHVPSAAHLVELRNLVDVKLPGAVLEAADRHSRSMQRDDDLDAAQLLALKTVQHRVRHHLFKKHHQHPRATPPPLPLPTKEARRTGGESFRSLALL